MRKIFTNFFAVAVVVGSCISSQAQGTMRVDGGAARIVASGAPSIVLNNMHFANNASSAMFTAANSDFYIQGTLTTNISSTGPFNTTFYNNIINKTGGAEILITTINGMTLTTTNTLTMTSGNVNMNGTAASTSTWVLGTSAASTGTLARTSGHYYNGYFQRWYPAGPHNPVTFDAAPWDVPVGMNAGSYNYTRIHYPAVASTGGSLRIMFNPINPFYTGMPLVDATDLLSCPGAVTINNCANEGYWIMQAANGMDLALPYSVKLNYTNFLAPTAEQCLRIIKSETLAAWMQEGVHGTFNGALDWVTRTGQTGFPGASNTAFFTIAGDKLVNPLPVELAAFNATCSSSSIIVNWTTSTENGNAYFLLERSKDLVNWEMAAMINSLNGNSNSTQQYSFEDHVYGGTFYYRLTQVDIDGTPKSYPPVSLTCTGTESDPALVNAYQNGDGQITVVLFAPSAMDYVVNLYDLHGQKISISTGMLTGGNTTLTLDAHMLRDAYYLVNVQIGDKNLSRKLFVK